MAKAVGASLVVIHSDLEVIVGHINGDYEAKKERMKEYLSMVRERISQKFLARFMQIPMGENEQADHLAKVASTEHMVVNYCQGRYTGDPYRGRLDNTFHLLS